MSETQTNTDTAATSNAGQEPKVETFSREYVEELRRENAGLRVSKKEAVEEAKTSARAEIVKEYEPQIAERDEKIATLEKDLSATSLRLKKLEAILAAGIPSEDVLEFVDLVQGTDDESIEDSVKRVKGLLDKRTTPSHQNPVDHSQGKGGSVPPLNGDPVLRILEQAVGAKPRRR